MSLEPQKSLSILAVSRKFSGGEDGLRLLRRRKVDVLHVHAAYSYASVIFKWSVNSTTS
jgi:hypothetical protein